MTVDCDVLVVGGGPAGCSAARAAAKKGLKTILIEEHEEIGNPVKCAEGIGEYLFPYLPFEVPKEQLIWKIDGMFFWSDNVSIERTSDQWSGYSVDRRKFDKWIAEKALKNGAKVYTKMELVGLELDKESNIKKAIINKNEKKYNISPNVLIAADGSESTVLDLLDLYNPKGGDIAEVYSWEMKNLDLYKPNLEQIYTGDFTPSGYAYIFPKSKTTANIGVGGIFPEKKMKEYFEDFLEIKPVKKQIKNAEYVCEKSGSIVWKDIAKKWIYGNILLAGDTANQALKPLGEGILPSIIAGDIAGKLSKKILYENRVDDKIYRNMFKEKINPHFQISEKYLEKVHYWFTNMGREKQLLLLSLISDLFVLKKLEELEEKEYKELKSKILKKIE